MSNRKIGGLVSVTYDPHLELVGPWFRERQKDSRSARGRAPHGYLRGYA